MWFFGKKPVKMSTDEVNRVAAEIEKEFLETQRRKEQERLEKERLERERQERERLERERQERERKAREELEKQRKKEEKEEDEDEDESYGDVRYSLDVPWESTDSAYEEIIKRYMKASEPTFVDRVNNVIAKKGLRAKDVYTAAQMDRKLFSKVTSTRNYKPAKDTCVAILMALKVDEYEARSMLQSAGYALSDSNKRDTVFSYFFSHAHYNIFDMNDVLYQLNEKPLGECRF